MSRLVFNPAAAARIPDIRKEHEISKVIDSLFFIRDFEALQGFVLDDLRHTMCQDVVREFADSEEMYDLLEFSVSVGLDRLYEHYDRLLERHNRDVSCMVSERTIIRAEDRLVRQLRCSLESLSSDTASAIMGLRAHPIRREDLKLVI